MYQTRYGADVHYEVAERFTEFAREHGYNPVPLAVSWVAHHPAVTAPIIGARTLDQLEGSLGALEIDMTPDLYETISDLAPTPPHPAPRHRSR